jgi:toxin HigB-1
MEVEFADPNLDVLEVDPKSTFGFSPEIVRGFRKTMQAVRSANDERDLLALRGLRFERLKGKRQHQFSLRINKQWRLIIEIEGPPKRVRIIGIEDYH